MFSEWILFLVVQNVHTKDANPIQDKQPSSCSNPVQQLLQQILGLMLFFLRNILGLMLTQDLQATAMIDTLQERSQEGENRQKINGLPTFLSPGGKTCICIFHNFFRQRQCSSRLLSLIQKPGSEVPYVFSRAYPVDQSELTSCIRPSSYSAS